MLLMNDSNFCYFVICCYLFLKITKIYGKNSILLFVIFIKNSTNIFSPISGVIYNSQITYNIHGFFFCWDVLYEVLYFGRITYNIFGDSCYTKSPIWFI
jgi:hypothetical protein